MDKQGNGKVAGHPAAWGLVLGLALGGCARQESTTHSAGRRSFETYIQQSCAFKKNDGDALSSTEHVSENPVVTGIFGRAYNQDWLSAVGHTSLVETAKFIRSKGVAIYAANPVSDQSCRNLDESFATDMPEDIAKFWFGMHDAEIGMMFTAFYMEKSQSKDLPSTHDHAVILIREDTNRWTLLHEFMHHNFKTHDQEKETYADVGLQKDELFKKISDIQASTQSPEEKVKLAAPLFSKFTKLLDRFIVQGLMEEIAVDATLQEAYDRADLTYVSPVSYEAVLLYIHQSERQMGALYGEMNKTYDYFRKLSDTGALRSEYKTFEVYALLRDTRLSQLRKVVAEREAAVKAWDMGFIRLGRDPHYSSSQSEVLPCPEAALRLKELADFTQTLRKKSGPRITQ